MHPFPVFNEAEVARNRVYMEYLLAEMRTHSIGHVDWKKTAQDAVLDQEIDIRQEWERAKSPSTRT